MPSLILTARWILPIDCPPIEDGEIEVAGSKIAYIGPQRQPFERSADAVVRDLGDAIILPGLVNVHTHLEYTMLRGFLEDVEFFPWIRTLTEVKARYVRDDWVVSATHGALECIAAGITTIGDNTDAGVTAEVARDVGLRARVYQEIFGIDQRDSANEQIAALDQKLSALRKFESERVSIGVSPHAPYTIRPELFKGLAAFCGENDLRTSIHLAESPAESLLIENGTGPFAEMYQRRGIEWLSPLCSPTRYLNDLGMLTPSALLVHCVHVDQADDELIAQSGASIAHCPKSNAKLGAGIAPLARWANNEDLCLRIGIGTDSAVSNNTLDLFEEMRFGLFAQRARNESVELAARQMIEMATFGGARALGWEDRIGTLTSGKQADITAVKIDNLHASPSSDPYATLVYATRADDVCLTMVDGRILYDSGVFLNSDADEVHFRTNKLRQRIAGETLPIT